MHPVGAIAATENGLTSSENVPRHTYAWFIKERSRSCSRVRYRGIESVPRETRKWIGRRDRLRDRCRIPHRRAQLVSILPRPEMLEAQAKGNHQVRPYTPGIFPIETDVPEVEIGTRQDVLLIEALELAFHKVCEIVAARVVLRSEGRGTVWVQSGIGIER